MSEKDEFLAALAERLRELRLSLGYKTAASFARAIGQLAHDKPPSITVKAGPVAVAVVVQSAANASSRASSPGPSGSGPLASLRGGRRGWARPLSS